MVQAVAKIETPKVPAVQSDAAAIFSMIERVMSDPSVPIERGEQAFAFWQKVQADQARKAFTQDFIAAQSEMVPILKNAKNDQTHSQYATHEALDTAIRPIYSAKGFAPTFGTRPSAKPLHITVTMTLLHQGGHERDYEIDMPTDGKGPKGNDVMTATHATGAAVSYGKRYLLIAAFNLAFVDKDKDGNKPPASGPVTETQIRELSDLLRIAGIEIEKFLLAGGYQSLSDIPSNQFDAAKRLIAKRGRGAAT